MALIDKLKAIGDGFRISRKTENEFTLDEMAAMAAEATATGNAQPEHVLAGYTFSNAEGTDKVGTCTYDADTSDGILFANKMTTDCKGYSKGELVRGTMGNFRGSADIAEGAALIINNKRQISFKCKTSNAVTKYINPNTSLDKEIRYIEDLEGNDIVLTSSNSIIEGEKAIAFGKNGYDVESNCLIEGTLPLATGETAITLDADAKYTFSARQAFEAGSAIAVDKDAFLATLPVWEGGSY